MRRFYVEKIESNRVILLNEEHNHLTNVLRSKTGDKIILICGDGYDYLAEIEQISKKQTQCTILNKSLSASSPRTQITVFMGLVKGDKFDYIVQKLTELGIYKIIPFTSKFCQVNAKKFNIDRIKKQVIAASKQCGRSEFLQVQFPVDFKNLIASLNDYDMVLFANETDKANTLNSKLMLPNKKVAIIVGSEGGFDANEVSEIVKQKNVHSVTLGKRILRAETAAVTLASVVCYEVGEWQ